MAIMKANWFLLWCTLGALGGLTDGWITNAEVNDQGISLRRLSVPFGIGSKGGLRWELSVLQLDWIDWVDGGAWEPEAMGIYVTTLPWAVKVAEEMAETHCSTVNSTEHFRPLVRFDEEVIMDAAMLGGIGGRGVVQGDLVFDEPGCYTVIFVSCSENVAAVSFDLQLEMYNDVMDGKGGRNYLPAGRMAYPHIYLAAFFAFGLLGLLWDRACAKGGRSAHVTHGVMLALVTLTSITMVVKAGQYYTESTDGFAGNWSHASYTLDGMTSCLFSTVLVLLGTGWPHHKMVLETREKSILILSVLSQICHYVLLFVATEVSSAKGSWIMKFVNEPSIPKLLSAVCTLLAFVWTMERLKQDPQAGGKDCELNLGKHRTFYIMLVLYYHIPLVVYPVLDVLLPCYLEWVGMVIELSATLAIYLIAGVTFFPSTVEEYLLVESEEP